MKYCKKPIVIEARQLGLTNHEEIAEWCGGLHRGTCLPAHEQVVRIETLEGEMTANVGDYIIKGIKGEFYPCKPDIFEASYDAVEDV